MRPSWPRRLGAALVVPLAYVTSLLLVTVIYGFEVTLYRNGVVPEWPKWLIFALVVPAWQFLPRVFRSQLASVRAWILGVDPTGILQVVTGYVESMNNRKFAEGAEFVTCPELVTEYVAESLNKSQAENMANMREAGSALVLQVHRPKLIRIAWNAAEAESEDLVGEFIKDVPIKLFAVRRFFHLRLVQDRWLIDGTESREFESSDVTTGPDGSASCHLGGLAGRLAKYRSWDENGPATT